MAAAARPPAACVAATVTTAAPVGLAAPIPITVAIAVTLATTVSIALSIPLAPLIGEGRGDEVMGGIDHGERGSGEAQGEDAQRCDNQKNMPPRASPASGMPRGGPRSHRHPAWYNDKQPLEYTVSSPGFNGASGAELAV
jgi:hypothetical protein